MESLDGSEREMTRQELIVENTRLYDELCEQIRTVAVMEDQDRIILELQAENANLRALLTKASHRLDAVWCVGKFVGSDADVFVEIAAVLKR